MKPRVLSAGFYPKELLHQGGRIYERIRASDSANVLVHDRTNDRILLVRQWRPGMVQDNRSDAMITETVAGRFDKDLHPRALLAKELLEEAGVRVSPGDITLLNLRKPMAVSAGSSTECAYLAHVEIHANQIEPEERVFGAEDEGEQIRRVWIPVKDLESYVCEDLRVFALIQWFLRKKKEG